MTIDRNNHTDNYKKVLWHVTVKGFQAGSLIAPLFMLARHRTKISTAKLLRGWWKGAVLGGILATGAGVGRMSSLNEEQIFNRNYRIAHNAGQNRTDLLSYVGAGIGAPVFWYIGSKSAGPISRMLGGAAIGMAAGVLVHVATSYGKDLTPSSMIEELKDVTLDEISQK